jgi:hypothetical protein
MALPSDSRSPSGNSPPASVVTSQDADGFAAASAAPTNGSRRFMTALLWFGSIATLVYWVVWFGVNRRWLATADTSEYYTFENAFPIADAWLAVTGALGAVALRRRRATALLWMLLAGSASVYLAGMDVLFDLENGIYRSGGDLANVGVELFINVGCFTGGIAILRFGWKYRHYFLSLESGTPQGGVRPDRDVLQRIAREDTTRT